MMNDLPEGFEKYLCEKYKMNPATFKLLYENKYSSDHKAYIAGMAQGRKEQAEKCKEARKRLDNILNPPPGEHEISRMNMGHATGEQDD